MWVAYQTGNDRVWLAEAVSPAEFKRMDEKATKHCFWTQHEAWEFAVARNNALVTRLRADLEQLEQEVALTQKAVARPMATVSPVRPESN